MNLITFRALVSLPAKYTDLEPWRKADKAALGHFAPGACSRSIDRLQRAAGRRNRQTMNAQEILPIYDRVANAFDKLRDKSLFERAWLDRALAHAPGRRVLDLGCGTGRPIAAYLHDRRAQITGVDGAAAMIALFQRHMPHAEAIHADMRGLDLGRTFDFILAWDSFFHLSPDDQRAMFATFAAHAAPGAALMFTTGSAEGEAMGEIEGEPLYHASLSADEYRSLLDGAGFSVLAHVAEDPTCGGHTVWLARYRR